MLKIVVILQRVLLILSYWFFRCCTKKSNNSMEVTKWIFGFVFQDLADWLGTFLLLGVLVSPLIKLFSFKTVIKKGKDKDND